MNIKNGLYLTESDFNHWGDYFSEKIKSKEKIFNEKNNTKELRIQNITFVVTEACNLNCSYCYEKHKTNRRMTKEIAKQAVNMIFNKKLINGYYNFDDKKAVILEFIGGEPLLEIDLIDYIVDYFKIKAFEVGSDWAFNYKISITTNGTLYETKKVQDFLNKNKDKVSCSITIDGNKKLHDSCRLFYDGSGSYDIVEKAVKHLLKNDNYQTTKITLCPDNVMFLNDAIKNVWDLGIMCAHTNCVFESGWTIEHAKILYSEMKKLADYILDNHIYDKNFCSLFDENIGSKLQEKKNWCGGNGEMLAIAPDGKCFSCVRFMKYSLTNPDVKEQPVGDIWNGLYSKKTNPWLIRLCAIDMITQCQHEDNKKCLTCPISRGCALCTGFNYNEFNDPDHKATYICDTHRARVLANVYFWNKLYKLLNIDKIFKLNLDDETALTIIDNKELNILKELSKGDD